MPKEGKDGKIATSIRVTPEAKRLVEKLAARLGIQQSAVWELAIREKAKTEGVG